MDDEVVVSRDMLRAIGAETRISMLKSLRQRQKTQSELASELGLSPPTVLEHMEQLEKAGLVELVPEYADRKWKYFRLTKTGRGLVEGRRMNVIMLLSTASALITGALLFLYSVMPRFEMVSSGMPSSTGSSNISRALTQFQSPAASLVGILAMLFLLLTIILLAALVIDRIARKRV